MDEAQLTKMLGKVQALLERADHPNTPREEADTARKMAQSIMTKYRIEEEELRQNRLASGTAAKPVEVEFSFLTDFGPYANHYFALMRESMRHLGVRGDYEYSRIPDEEGRLRSTYTMTLIGFDAEVQLVQMLYTNLRLTFSERLEPSIDSSLSDADNVYRLRSAGIERNRIARLLWGQDTHSAHAKVGKLYKEACLSRGEDPKVSGRQTNAKTFRGSYADAFVVEVGNRLRYMRMTDGVNSSALVLAGRQEAVDEAYYEKYPHLRPKPAVEGVSRADCPRCKKAKTGYCRAHKPYKPKDRPYSVAGWSAGTQAAREADLSSVSARPTGRIS